MTKEKEVVIYQCSHIGVAGTTDVHVRKQPDGTFEARCGIAIMGATNMDEARFKAANYDPFNHRFRDNWAAGNGATEAEALDALKADMRSTARRLVMGILMTRPHSDRSQGAGAAMSAATTPTQRVERIQREIEGVASQYDVGSWEQLFLENIKPQRTLSPRQEAKLAEIEHKVFPGAADKDTLDLGIE